MRAPSLSSFRLLLVHYGLYQLAVALAGGFVGAYLLKSGFSLAAALTAYCGLLTARFGLRLISLSVVRYCGYKWAMIIGASLMAAQYPVLMRVDEPIWALSWVLMVAVAESLYWPVYHSAAAVMGGENRGAELGIRTAVAAIAGIVGPIAGGLLLAWFGPALDFAVGSGLTLLSLVPLLAMPRVPAGPVPTIRDSIRALDLPAVAAFAADGLMASGLAVAWPMVLFLCLGSRFELLGFTSAGAGLVGAVAGIVCGRAVDRGERERYVVIVCCALAAGFILRAGGSWSPLAATAATATGAAIMGLYVPVLISIVYERAQQCGAAYRFHFTAEAGWDAGAAIGCLLAAAVVWATAIPSLAVLPASLGVLAFYWSVRGVGALPSTLPLPHGDRSHQQGTPVVASVEGHR